MAAAWRQRVGRLIGIAAATGVLLGLGFYAGRRAREPAAEPASGERLADTATVLVAVRELARLESVAFHMERIIDLKHRQARLFGMVHADDEILLVAAGDVIAGVDLSKLRAQDIQVTPSEARVRLRLPAPEILSARLDNDRTYVHTRKTDLLARRVDTIETRARQLAERSVRDAALETGILERAADSARHTLAAFLRSLGYRQVDIRFAER